MKVYKAQTSGGKDLILNYIDGLSKAESADGYSVIEKLEQAKWDELTIKPWRGKVSEVYFYKHNRIFYVVVDGENIYLLHVCRKQKNRTEKQDIEIIIKRAKALGEKLSVKFI